MLQTKTVLICQAGASPQPEAELALKKVQAPCFRLLGHMQEVMSVAEGFVVSLDVYTIWLMILFLLPSKYFVPSSLV